MLRLLRSLLPLIAIGHLLLCTVLVSAQSACGLAMIVRQMRMIGYSSISLSLIISCVTFNHHLIEGVRWGTLARASSALS